MWRRVFSPQQQQQHRRAAATSSNSPPKSKDPFDYCANLVRQRDRESYLCTLILPPESRQAAFAIRAFNVELSNVRSMVSNPNTALMRFQFWSSTLGKIFDDHRAKTNKSAGTTGDISASIPEHPVAEALSISIRDKKLSRKWLSELIESRVERVDERRTFRTINELEDFYQRTFGAVLFLLLESNNVRHVQADHAASHLGKALGFVNGLRAVNADPERNVNILPLELLVHHRVSQEDVVRSALAQRRGRNLGDVGDLQKRMRDLTFDLASQAHVHLEHARKLNKDAFGNKKDDNGKVRKQLYESTRLVLLPAAIVDHYLQLLRKLDFDILNRKFSASYDWLALTLWWRNFKNSY